MPRRLAGIALRTQPSQPCCLGNFNDAPGFNAVLDDGEPAALAAKRLRSCACRLFGGGRTLMTLRFWPVDMDLAADRLRSWGMLSRYSLKAAASALDMGIASRRRGWSEWCARSRRWGGGRGPWECFSAEWAAGLLLRGLGRVLARAAREKVARRIWEKRILPR